MKWGPAVSVAAFVLAFTWGAQSASAAIVLDPDFGGDGIVTTPIGSNLGDQDIGLGMSMQPDGKVVLAGGLNEDRFALARYNAGGTLDTSFGTGGKVTTDISGAPTGTTGTDEARAVAIQPDGKIVAAGFADALSNAGGLGGDFAVVRYNANGTLDTGFGGGDGIVTTQAGDFPGPAFALALQGDGKIVLAGRAPAGGHDDFALVRYNTDGSLDTDFDEDGRLTTDVGGESRNDQANAVAIQANGKIVAAGYSNIGGGGFKADFSLARYNADGSLDTGFSGDGKVTTPISTNADPFNYDEANAVVIQPDGKIVAAGSSQGTNSAGGIADDFALVRYNPNGSLDATFSGDGKAKAGFVGGPAHALALQPDGKLVAAGRSTVCGSDCNFASARFNPNGTLDSSYGGNGRITTAVAPDEQVDLARAVAVQPDGELLVGGYADMGPPAFFDYDFALLRYVAVPDPPTLTATDPQSPANHNNPKVKGVVGGGDPVEIKVYKNASCSGSPAATGSVASFTGAGIAVSVAENATTALSARAIDTEAKASPCSNSISYKEDSIAPITTINSGPSGPTKDKTPAFAFSSNEPGSSFECRVGSGGFGACSGPGNSHMTDALPDGPHIFEVRATDPAGNADLSPGSRNFTVDTTPPETTITKHPRKRTERRRANFEFISSEKESEFKCRLDDRRKRDCDSPKTYRRLAFGWHVFRVWAKDLAGNRDPEPDKFRWKVLK